MEVQGKGLRPPGMVSTTEGQMKETVGEESALRYRRCYIILGECIALWGERKQVLLWQMHVCVQVAQQQACGPPQTLQQPTVAGGS